MTYIKIVGYFRTGTNYVQWLLENNFHDIVVLVNHFGYKHGNPESYFTDYVKDASFNSYGKKTTIESTEKLSEYQKKSVLKAWEKRQMKYVICFRGPYSWMHSYIRYRKRGFKKTYIEEWNKRTKQHYDFYEKNKANSVLVRQEDLVANPLLVLREINDKFELGKDAPFRISRNKTDRGGRLTKNTLNESFYKNREYLNLFNNKEIEFLERKTDKELCKKIYNDTYSMGDATGILENQAVIK